MSIECSECEHDLRGGHDPTCSRYVPHTAECRERMEDGMPCNCGARPTPGAAAGRPGEEPSATDILDEIEKEVRRWPTSPTEIRHFTLPKLKALRAALAAAEQRHQEEMAKLHGGLFERIEAAEQRAERAGAALKPFARFAAMWSANPIGGRQLPDDHVIYGIHTGTEWEAHLTLGDFRRALAPTGDRRGIVSRDAEAADSPANPSSVTGVGVWRRDEAVRQWRLLMANGYHMEDELDGLCDAVERAVASAPTGDRAEPAGGEWNGDDIRRVEITFMPDTPLRNEVLIIKSVNGCEAVAAGLNSAGYPLPRRAAEPTGGGDETA